MNTDLKELTTFWSHFTEITSTGVLFSFIDKTIKAATKPKSAIDKAEEAANVKAAVKKAAAVAAEAKPTIGDANDALQALKDKMDGK